jgi:hypothetical protein
MKADLTEEIALMNRNVDEMIRLCQCATEAGLWSQQKAEQHTARLESFREKLNADFRELIALREHADQTRERGRRETPSLMPEH